jgi:hypothetical protein
MDRTQTAMTPKAPGAATPGYGAGNVPFSPGLMSGRTLGQSTNRQPLAREAAGGLTLNINSAQPPEPKQPQPPGLPAAPMPQGPIISPEVYFRFLNAYMDALMESVETGRPLVGGIY